MLLASDNFHRRDACLPSFGTNEVVCEWLLQGGWLLVEQLVERAFGHIAILAGQHQLTLLLTLLVLCIIAAASVFLQLFYSVTISERVEGVLAARGCGRNVCNHRCLAVASE